ncbi:MAG: ABC transporter ATP-binding protein [Acidimicrobiales bacterium]
MTAVSAPPGGCDLDVRDVSKAFGPQVVLDRLSLVAPAGSLTAILGPSGSGKTTLLRVLAGFERADGGAVTLGGVVVDSAVAGGGGTYVAPEHRRIGYVPQEGGLFPHLTVARNVAFGLPRGRRRRERVEGLLAMVGMAEMGRRYPHQLSGGQQQRVALARALAVEPGLVLLDEPFSALDAGLRSAVRAEVRAVLRSAGATGLLVTHDQDEALSWADRVAVLRDGRVGQLDTPEGVYRRPADPDVAGFVGEANVLPGVAEPGGVRTVLGVHAVDGDGAGAEGAIEGEAVAVLVRPEQVELMAPGDLVAEEGGSGGAPVAGRVRDYQYFGHDAVVRVDLAGAPPSPLVVRVMGGSRWSPGDEVGVRVRGRVLAWPASHSRTTGALTPPAGRVR